MDPAAMADMMDSPLMQAMLSNTDFMRSMMDANPATRGIMQANPELARAMQDPETMRQIAAAARNPALMTELMRGQDRALANIEMLPGGANALRRMYETVQEPLERGLQEGAADNNDAAPRQQQPPPAADAPLPNPWQQQQRQRPAGAWRGSACMTSTACCERQR